MKNDVKDIDKQLNEERTLNINETEQVKLNPQSSDRIAMTRRRKRYWKWVRRRRG
jgi:hypothetical protein